MGRGGYLGGSTIINLRRDGWSSSGTNKSKKGKKRVSPEVLARRKAIKEAEQAKKKIKQKEKYEKAMAVHARSCGRAALSGKQLPKTPKIILSFLEGNEGEVVRRVKAHPSYQIDDATRKQILEETKAAFARACAINVFRNKTAPKIPHYLRKILSRNELSKFMSNIEDHPDFVKTIEQREPRWADAEKRREAQRCKMDKIIVVRKTRPRRWKKK